MIISNMAVSLVDLPGKITILPVFQADESSRGIRQVEILVPLQEVLRTLAHDNRLLGLEDSFMELAESLDKDAFLRISATESDVGKTPMLSTSLIFVADTYRKGWNPFTDEPYERDL